VSTVTTFAIVPVKALGEAKRRLAPALAPAQRRRWVLTMLEDVLGLLGHVDSIARILVVTPDADVASVATGRGAVVVREERRGGDLNAAVRLGLAHARSQGADRALVVPADVPLATHAEMLSVLTSVSADPARQVAIVPSEDGEGTNALLLAPPDVLQPEFGEGSFVRHVAQAVALGLDFRVLRLPGLGTDIDQPRDLARLAAATAGSDRYSFLDTAANEGSRQEPSR
jgi:2-phospho-L-lactate guanylyltransferase